MSEFHESPAFSEENAVESTRRNLSENAVVHTRPTQWSQQLSERLTRFLALSAAVSYHDLEQRDGTGRTRFSRGRYKYYGLGSLVVFFAFFSAYGMGHMLSTMADMTWYGAAIAGFVWGVFQWCLERQMLISIQTNAAWWKKAIGLTWRSGLALMSASVMVYPFFVQTNRSEIDVRIGEITQARLLENKSKSEQIVGLPRIQQAAIEQQDNIAQLEKASLSAAPDISLFLQRAKNCWQRLQKSEREWDAQIRDLRQTSKLSGDGATAKVTSDSNSVKINALLEKKSQAREACQQADFAVNKRNAEWRQQKSRELNAAQVEHQTTLNEEKQAREKSGRLFDAQAERVQRSAQSGFAADFFAVAKMLEDDPFRRFQLLWWLSWFLAIEMVAILIKFGTSSDFDVFMHFTEQALLTELEKEAKLRHETQTSEYLQAYVQAKAEQAYWENQAPETLEQVVKTEKLADQTLRTEVAAFQRECGRSTAMLEAALSEFERFESLVQKARARERNRELTQTDDQATSHSSMQKLCELAETDLQTRLTKALSQVRKPEPA